MLLTPGEPQMPVGLAMPPVPVMRVGLPMQFGPAMPPAPVTRVVLPMQFGPPMPPVPVMRVELPMLLGLLLQMRVGLLRMLHKQKTPPVPAMRVELPMLLGLLPQMPRALPSTPREQKMLHELQMRRGRKTPPDRSNSDSKLNDASPPA